MVLVRNSVKEQLSLFVFYFIILIEYRGILATTFPPLSLSQAVACIFSSDKFKGKLVISLNEGNLIFSKDQKF